MSGRERFVAIGLLTQRDMDALGSGFHRAFPLDDASAFDDLLKAINEASPSPADNKRPIGRR